MTKEKMIAEVKEHLNIGLMLATADTDDYKGVPENLAIANYLIDKLIDCDYCFIDDKSNSLYVDIYNYLVTVCSQLTIKHKYL